ncbi:ribonuclease H-like domain-containing protein [Xylariaceae sp. FL0255]|nr:ribonuclease H-like domain-containing protein [Xylariaceae sp. FL0255]
MALELSSNWKKLQAKLKAETSSSSTPTSSTGKRKVESKVPPQGPASKKLKSREHKAPNKTTKPKTTPHTSSSKRPSAMGITQSSAVVKGTPATVTPSLALWAEDNDISPEDLAEAYNLGIKRRVGTTFSKATSAEDHQRFGEGLAPGVQVGKYIAMDCEMVGVGPSRQANMLARVSCVDFHGNQVYDSLVTPQEPVTDYRTDITGLTPSMLRGSKARPFSEVQASIAELLRGRILVGHDIKHDLAVLLLSHPSPQVRDTSRHSSFRKFGHGPKPALKILARDILGLDEFQTGAHSSVEDARVAMLLFREKKSEFDVNNATKFGLPATADDFSAPKKKFHKKKKR